MPASGLPVVWNDEPISSSADRRQHIREASQGSPQVADVYTHDLRGRRCIGAEDILAYFQGRSHAVSVSNQVGQQVELSSRQGDGFAVDRDVVGREIQLDRARADLVSSLRARLELSYLRGWRGRPVAAATDAWRGGVHGEWLDERSAPQSRVRR